MGNERDVYIVGAGGHAKVVISTLHAAGYDVKGVFDDDEGKWGEQLLGVPVIGAPAELNNLSPVRALVAVGGNPIRKALVERFIKVDWVTVIHPSAEVHSSVRLGAGTVVFAGAIIQPDAIIGAHAIINTGALIDHDCVIGDYAHVAPRANLAGGVWLGEGVFLGIGSSVIPGVRIGSWTTLGAGGVAIKNLPSGAVAVGLPARVIKQQNRYE